MSIDFIEATIREWVAAGYTADEIHSMLTAARSTFGLSDEGACTIIAAIVPPANADAWLDTLTRAF